jgi:hypothetical protein
MSCPGTSSRALQSNSEKTTLDGFSGLVDGFVHPYTAVHISFRVHIQIGSISESGFIISIGERSCS